MAWKGKSDPKGECPENMAAKERMRRMRPLMEGGQRTGMNGLAGTCPRWLQDADSGHAL